MSITLECAGPMCWNGDCPKHDAEYAAYAAGGCGACDGARAYGHVESCPAGGF